MISCNFLEIIKDTFFIKHLQASSEKIPWLLVEDIIVSPLKFLILIDTILIDLLMGCRILSSNFLL